MAAVAFAAMAAPAFAQDMYLQVNVGAFTGGEVDGQVDIFVPTRSTTKETADLDNAPFVSVALGFSNSGPIAVELEGVYIKADFDDPTFVDTELESQVLFVNGVYTLDGNGTLTPYVGAGLGWGKTDLSDPTGSDDDNGLAWQLKAGFTVPVGGMTLDAGYRYISLPRYDISDPATRFRAEPAGHVFSVGARFGF